MSATQATARNITAPEELGQALFDLFGLGPCLGGCTALVAAAMAAGASGQTPTGSGYGGGASPLGGVEGEVHGPGVDRHLDPGAPQGGFDLSIGGGSFSIPDAFAGKLRAPHPQEVTYLPDGAQQGRNLGWRCFEGTHVFSGCSPAGGHTGPIHEYAHGPGCSVTGGYVYRGSKIRDLAGAYVFADFCVGRLRAFVNKSGSATGHRFLGPQTGNLASFGQDASGELYVLSHAGPVYLVVSALDSLLLRTGQSPSVSQSRMVDGARQS